MTVRRKWSKQLVIEAIRDRQRRGLTLVGIYDKDRGLYCAAWKYFGGWREAIRSAGIETEKASRSWNKQSVIDAMLKRRARGLSLSRVSVEDRLLYTAACRRFGNWQNAMQAAGPKPKSHRRWSKQRVIKELRVWYRRSELSVHILDPLLASAALRLFGDLNKALEAAGLEPRYERWSPQRVLEELQNQYVHGVCVDDLKGRDRSLTLAAVRFFGSWHGALRCAGIIDRGKSK